MPGLDKANESYYKRLYKNLGNCEFEDVTEKAGVRGSGYNLGVVTGDYDNDGFTDVFVCGLRANILYHNNGDGTFSDVSIKAGFNKPDPLFGSLWVVRAAFVDYDRNGYLDLFVSNYCVWDPGTVPVCQVNGSVDYFHPRLYKGLPNSLFHNNGDGTFTNVSVVSGIRQYIGKGMGTGIADFNDDGWKDLFIACGDVMDMGGFFSARVPQSNAVYVNLKNGRFAEASPSAGTDFQRKAIHGGCALGDLDNDGRIDAVVTALNAPMVIFQNMSPKQNHWLGVKTVGTKSSWDGMGAKIKLVSASGSQFNHVNTAVGYGCASPAEVHFGLGPDSIINALQITWPSGSIQTLEGIKADQVLIVREP